MPMPDIKFLNQSSVKLNFTSKRITSYGGFALLAKLFEKIDLKASIEKMIPFEENSPNGTGFYAKILRFGLTVISGGRRYAHSAFLGDSPEVYEKTFAIEKMPTSASALTRFFAKFCSWQAVERFSDNIWNYCLEKIIPFSTMDTEYLTFDSTVITRYGKQEGAKKGYNPRRKGRLSHHPILAFLNRSKYVVNIWNRSGNTSSGNGIVEFARQTMFRLKGKIKILGCFADSSFYNVQFAKYLEEENIEYVIAARFLGVIQSQVIAIKDWKEVSDGIDVGEFMFCHDDEKWDKPRRYVVIRQKVKDEQNPPQGKALSLFPEDDKKYMEYRYGIYLTSSTKPAEEVWRNYRLRAGDEGIIKENKNDFGLEGFSSEGFYATEAAMLVRILFYNILNRFRSSCLPEKESRQTLHTIRCKYFIIPAILGRNSKQEVLRLGLSKKSSKNKIMWIINKIEKLFSTAMHLGNQTGESLP